MKEKINDTFELPWVVTPLIIAFADTFYIYIYIWNFLSFSCVYIVKIQCPFFKYIVENNFFPTYEN